MNVRRFSVGRALDEITDKIFDSYNRYVLKINEDDLNPEIPLTTKSDWRKNHVAGLSYTLMGVGMGGLVLFSGYLSVRDFAYMVHHFGDLGAMLQDFGLGVLDLTLMGLTAKLAKTSFYTVENLFAKTNNEYNIPE